MIDFIIQNLPETLMIYLKSWDFAGRLTSHITRCRAAALDGIDSLGDPWSKILISSKKASENYSDCTAVPNSS